MFTNLPTITCTLNNDYVLLSRNYVKNFKKFLEDFPNIKLCITQLYRNFRMTEANARIILQPTLFHASFDCVLCTQH